MLPRDLGERGVFVLQQGLSNAPSVPNPSVGIYVFLSPGVCAHERALVPRDSFALIKV